MKKKILNKKKKAFTLAETLITLTILGIVAAITIPALINRQQEAANRTKVKKAMTMYEKALNQMILENDIKGNVGTELNDETCSKTTEYFKKVERDNCRFKTADRVWWDITDIEHTVIMLNDKYKDTELAELRNLAKDKDNRDVFEMVGGIKDGIVRINDLNYEMKYNDDLVKIYKFLGFDVKESSSMDKYLRGDFGKLCENPNGIYDTCTNCKSCYVYGRYNSYRYVYDESGKLIANVDHCWDTSTGDFNTCGYGQFYKKFESPTNYEKIQCDSPDFKGRCYIRWITTEHEDAKYFYNAETNTIPSNWKDYCGGSYCDSVGVTVSGSISIYCKSNATLKEVDGRYICVKT